MTQDYETAMELLANTNPQILAQLKEARDRVATTVPGSLTVECPRDNASMSATADMAQDSMGNAIAVYNLECPTCGRKWTIPGYDRILRVKYRSN